ncbi:MAG TPA: phosphoglycerate dehydrogenase, partial [Dehalococcoidia bacterium]|nr:phosphoglycerate dehydrogenase [Dehalococcoidia bacterium]
MGLELIPAKMTQVLTEEELMKELPSCEGWIIGDDPASYRVFASGREGKLRAAVKWGIGVDNVDFDACSALDIPIANTPNMFGGEVADLAIGYIIALARKTFEIDRGIRSGDWPKPAGVSISGKTVGVVGFGDIGKSLVNRLGGFDVRAYVYDPGVTGSEGFDFVIRKTFPDGLGDVDFLVFTCALNKHNFHMLNVETLRLLKHGSAVINVARGPLIQEEALIVELKRGHISSVALDVFENEPLPVSSPLRTIPNCIFGSHNGSNTVEGVRRATMVAI